MHRRKASLLKALSGPDLEIAETGVYPNMKEWHESQALLRAVQTHLPKWHPGDSRITVVSVGDGKTPRCGILFARHTSWTVYSVDPDMWGGEHRRLRRMMGRKPWLKRLTCVQSGIEDFSVSSPKLLIVACHAHVTTGQMLAALPAQNRALVCMPCCTPQDEAGGRLPDVAYADKAVPSPERTVKVWRRV